MENNERRRLEKKIIIEGIIEAKTGLHVGGSKETLKIGGCDDPVITDAQGKFFIPGSSLKGKIRCLLERSEGRYSDDGKPCVCGDCDICKLFGPHQSNNIKEIRRLIFRDAYLVKKENDEYIPLNSWEVRENNYIEIKPENVIDRISGTALHPRFIERVVAGSKFKFEIILDIYSDDDEKKLLEKLISGIKLLENDYLGGSGSRGYGKVEFKEIKITKFDPKTGETKFIKEKIDSLDKIKVEEILKGENQ